MQKRVFYLKISIVILNKKRGVTMGENQGQQNPGAGTDYARRMRLERAKQTAAQTPSTGALILKVAIGALFIVVGATGGDEGFNLTVFLTGLVIGIALIAWGILGYRQQKKQIEDARLDIVLSTPLETLGNPEIDALAKKYDEAEAGKTDSSK